MPRLSSRSTLDTVTQTQEPQSDFCPVIDRVCFFAQIETDIRDWLFELQDSRRLNIALKAFKAIDQQMKIGADVREVGGQVLREIRIDFGNVKDRMGALVSDIKETMDNSVKDYLTDIVEQAKQARRKLKNSSGRTSRIKYLTLWKRLNFSSNKARPLMRLKRN